MFGKRNDKTVVVAEHGRWIVRLRNGVRVLEQRLQGLERRVATLEENLTRLDKSYGKLDLGLANLIDELARLGSQVDALVGPHGRAKSGRRR